MEAEEAPNTAQREQWNGTTGAYWAAAADRFECGVAAYCEPFEEACAIAQGDRVVDVGCGSGVTTRSAARRARDGRALGVDLFGPLIELARRRTEHGARRTRRSRTPTRRSTPSRRVRPTS